MDSSRFDELAKSIAEAASRRSLLKGVAAGAAGTVLALVGVVQGDDLTAEARKRRQRQHKRHNERKNERDKKDKKREKKRKKRAPDCEGNGDCSQPDNPCEKRECRGGKCEKETRQNGASCGSGQVCAGGQCVASCGGSNAPCPAGTTCCSGACVNTTNNFSNCGGCGATCSQDTATTCAESSCRCGQGPACPAGSDCANGQCVATISPANMQGWQFYKESPSNEAGPIAATFDAGPGTPPVGEGSAHLEVVLSTEGKILSANIFNGVPLRDFETLRYSSYQEDTTTDTPPSLQLGIDFDLTDGDTGFQGRLVWVPGRTTQVVQADVWQEWDALDDSKGGAWFFTRAPGNAVCPQTASGPMCTLAAALAPFPNIGIHPIGGDGTGAGLGFIGLKVGSGDSELATNADALTVKLTGANQQTTVFNFEPNP